jgi:hypothetical protein
MPSPVAERLKNNKSPGRTSSGFTSRPPPQRATVVRGTSIPTTSRYINLANPEQSIPERSIPPGLYGAPSQRAPPDRQSPAVDR